MPSNDIAMTSVDSGAAWRSSRGSARALRYVSLLYTGFFFIEPYFRRSVSHWLWFAAFYVTFLTLYFAIAKTQGRTQQILFGLLFLLGYVYFPFNQSASGAFVFPVVMLAFVIRSTRVYIGVVLAAVTGIMLETWIFHLPWWAGGMGAFFSVVVGFSNLTYSRQQQASFMLRRANEEIEHLAQVAERERIARDLHDLLGHTLTVIAIKSELANRILERDPQRAQQEMIEVEQTARKALADVREAVAGYRSEGLAAEISRARRTLVSAEVMLSATAPAEELSMIEANILCLCLREAVTNIVRHARAAACDVRLLNAGNTLKLVIEDDGSGFEGREGNGLRGMRERVESIGGNLRIHKKANGGTELSVTLPRDRDKLCSDKPMTKTAEELTV